MNIFMKPQLIIWLALTVLYSCAYFFHAFFIIFSVGEWISGVTINYLLDHVVISQTALIFSIISKRFIIVSTLITMPLLTTIFVKFLYFVILGFEVKFANDILERILICFPFLIIYTALFFNLFKLSIRSLFLIIAFKLFALVYIANQLAQEILPPID